MKKKTVEKNNMEGDLRKDKHIIRHKRAVKFTILTPIIGRYSYVLQTYLQSFLSLILNI